MLLALLNLFALDLGSRPLFFLAATLTLLVVAVPSLPGRLPSWFWRLSTPALVLWILADFALSRPEFIAPLVRMVTLLALLRAVSYRRRREDLQLVLLCLFMVVIAGVFTLSLGFALQVLAFTPVAMLILFLVCLSECSAREEEAGSKLWEGFSWKRFAGRVWAACDYRLLGFSALLFALVLSLAGLIFVIIPRFSLDHALPFLGLRSTKSLSGFSESVRFGEVSDIVEDNSVALRVEIPKGLSPPWNPYWRMLVLDQYTGEGFRLSSSARAQFRHGADHYFGSSLHRFPPAPETERWLFYLEGGISRFLPRLGPFRGLRFPNRQSVSFHGPLGLVATRDILSNLLVFQVEGMAMADSWPAARGEREALSGAESLSPDNPPEPPPGHGPRYPFTTTDLPLEETDHGRLLTVLESIRSRAGLSEGGWTVEAFASAATEWLQSRHQYALRSRIPEGPGDPLVRWMLSTEPGHCELFSGAFTLLARAAGFPARVVVGFAGGSWNGYENYFMIRNREAHAWVEVFDGADHWLRFDPTPARDPSLLSVGLEEGFVLSVGIDRTFRAYLDSLRILWYRRIVNFDREQQQEVASRAREFGSALFSHLRDTAKSWSARLADWFSRPWDFRHLAEASAVLLGLTLLVLLGRALWRHRRRLAAAHDPFPATPTDPLRRAAGRLLRRYSESGLASLPEAGRTFSDLLEVRFGHVPGPGASQTVRQARRLYWRLAIRRPPAEAPSLPPESENVARQADGTSPGRDPKGTKLA